MLYFECLLFYQVITLFYLIDCLLLCINGPE